MSAKVTDWVWHHFKGTQDEKLVMLYLAYLAHDNGVMEYRYVVHQDIYTRTGVSFEIIETIFEAYIGETEADYVIKPYAEYLSKQFDDDLLFKLMQDRLEHLRDSGRISAEVYDYITDRSIFT
jgi:hypothetical protein